LAEGEWVAIFPSCRSLTMAFFWRSLNTFARPFFLQGI
jgi:hypothetical protein